MRRKKTKKKDKNKTNKQAISSFDLHVRKSKVLVLCFMTFFYFFYFFMCDNRFVAFFLDSPLQVVLRLPFTLLKFHEELTNVKNLCTHRDTFIEEIRRGSARF